MPKKFTNAEVQKILERASKRKEYDLKINVEFERKVDQTFLQLQIIQKNGSVLIEDWDGVEPKKGNHLRKQYENKAAQLLASGLKAKYEFIEK